MPQSESDDSSDDEYVPQKGVESSSESSASDNEDDTSKNVNEPETVLENKKSADDLWKEFLGSDSSIPETLTKNEQSIKSVEIDTVKVETKSISDVIKPKITQPVEILEFCGEEIRINNSDSVQDDPEDQSSSSNLNNQIKPESSSSQKPKPAGLSSILNTIGNKRKINTLEKSKLDWDTFKKQSKLEDELTQFNRGKNGYLEKQEFLIKADLKQFELEREIRNTGRKKT